MDLAILTSGSGWIQIDRTSGEVTFELRFDSLGWPRNLNSSNRPARTRMPGRVAGTRGITLNPYADWVRSLLVVLILVPEMQRQHGHVQDANDQERAVRGDGDLGAGP